VQRSKPEAGASVILAPVPASAKIRRLNASEQWLSDHKYTVAPVTLDNSDYMFASTYAAGKKDGVLAAYIPYMQSVVDFFVVSLSRSSAAIPADLLITRVN